MRRVTPQFFPPECHCCADNARLGLVDGDEHERGIRRASTREIRETPVGVRQLLLQLRPGNVKRVGQLPNRADGVGRRSPSGVVQAELVETAIIGRAVGAPAYERGGQPEPA